MAPEAFGQCGPDGDVRHYWNGCRLPKCRAAHTRYESERNRKRGGARLPGRQDGAIPRMKPASKAAPRADRGTSDEMTFTISEIRKARGL